MCPQAGSRSKRLVVLVLQPGLAVRVPWEQQHCQQGTGEAAGSWLDGPWSRGGVCEKGGPEVRTFGEGGAATRRVLKRKPLRSQLHSGFPERVSGFRCQQLWLRVLGWNDQQTLGEQLPTDTGGMRTSLAMLWTRTAHPYPEETDQAATRSPLVGSWP